MFDITKVRADFPILESKVYGRPLVYLDSGATAQKPLRVIERENYMYRHMNANVHRGIHYMSEETTSMYEAARETVRGFINARSTREIVFTAGATAGINTVAYSIGELCIGEGDNVVVSEMEHHANIVPWQLVCERKGAHLRVLPFDDEGRLETEKLAGMIDERTRIVAVTHGSNVLGTVPEVKEVVRIAHSAGVPVLLDGCQRIVHGGVDVRDLDCEFYVFSGHKLYGPLGIGVLYGKEEWLDRLPPFMGGGDMVGTVTFEKTTYAELPLKFEAGTANYIGAIGMAEAMRYVEGLGIDAIAGHEYALLNKATELVGEIDGVHIYGTQPDKCPVVSFTADGAHPYDIGMILDKLGVAIRTGTHCAEPVMTHYGLTGMCRASMAMYNTLEEIEMFAGGLRRALSMLR